MTTDAHLAPPGSPPPEKTQNVFERIAGELLPAETFRDIGTPSEPSAAADHLISVHHHGGGDARWTSARRRPAGRSDAQAEPENGGGAAHR